MSGPLISHPHSKEDIQHEEVFAFHISGCVWIVIDCPAEHNPFNKRSEHNQRFCCAHHISGCRTKRRVDSRLGRCVPRGTGKPKQRQWWTNGYWPPGDQLGWSWWS